MNIFELGIQRTDTGRPIPIGLKPVANPCTEASYTFEPVRGTESLVEGGSVEVEVSGGIGPFTWTVVSPGISAEYVTTEGRMNVLTCDLVPYDERAYYTVTDSCGNVVSSYATIIADFDGGCISGDCATYPAMEITGPLTDVDIGSQFVATGGLPPYRWRLTGSAIDSTGTVQGFYPLASDTYYLTVTAIDMCGNRATLEVERACDVLANPLYVSASPVYCYRNRGVGIGSVFSASGGIAPYTFITTGDITLDVDGVVTAITSCAFTVKAIDKCGNEGYYRTLQSSCLGDWQTAALSQDGMTFIAVDVGGNLWWSFTGTGYLDITENVAVLEDYVPGCADAVHVRSADSSSGDGWYEADICGVCGIVSSACWGAYKDLPLTALDISGPGQVEVGAFYGASGGAPDYTYSFSSGSINSSTGEILSIDSCGDSGSVAMGTVSAQDSCGNTVDLDVRLPDGVWVQQGATVQHPNYYWAWSIFAGQVEEISGNSRLLISFTRYTCSNCDCGDSAGSCGSLAPFTAGSYSCRGPITYGEYFNTTPSTCEYSAIFPAFYTQYQWECP